MDVDRIEKRLNKIKHLKPDFDFRFGDKIDFEKIECKLNIKFPEKVKTFYKYNNGLKTYNPDFEIIELNKLHIKNYLIHFATFDNENFIYFDTKELNRANEWTIIEKNKNYALTLTISSFWSNKIWHWINNRTIIWKDKYWE
jgi:hypothetical protein